MRTLEYPRITQVQRTILNRENSKGLKYPKLVVLYPNHCKMQVRKAEKSRKKREITIFGANKKIASKLSLGKHQLLSQQGFHAIHNIDDVNSPVKGKFKKQTESLQFQRWFKGSKVIDENERYVNTKIAETWSRAAGV